MGTPEDTIPAGQQAMSPNAFAVMSLRAIEGQLVGEEWAGFEQLLRESPEFRMQHLLLCRQSVRFGELGQPPVHTGMSSNGIDDSMLDQVILRELIEQALQDRHDHEMQEQSEQMLRAALEQERMRRLAEAETNPAPKPPRLIIIPRPLFYAALVLLCLSLVYAVLIMRPASSDPHYVDQPPPAEHPSVLAVLQRLSPDAQWGGTFRPAVGEDLVAQELELLSGVAMIRFSTGVEAELVGPAKFHLLDAGLTRMELGEVSVVVPEAGHGFAVQVPGGIVTDYGTAFEVMVPHPDLGMANRVDVSQGFVVVESVDAAGEVQRSVQLRRNQYAELDQAEPGLRAYEPVQERVTLDCPSTGVGLEPGRVDKNWSVIPPDGGEPLPAYVISPIVLDPHQGSIFWLPGDIRSSQWLSPWVQASASPDDEPRLADLLAYGMQTTINLPEGIDPASASLTLHVIYDDYIDGIYLNGEKVAGPYISPVPGVDERDEVQYKTWTRIDLPAVLKAGDNTLRIDMRNYNGISGMRVRMVLNAVQTTRELEVSQP